MSSEPKLKLLAVSIFSVWALSGCGGAEHGDYRQRNPDFLAVTQKYGKAVVHEGEFFAEASKVPWSGWWYPKNSKALFQRGSGKAPLEKYDAYAKAAHGQNAAAAAFEQNFLFKPGAYSWEGHCHAWAFASIMEPEPTKEVTAGGVTFGVGDLKALLIKSYENVEGLSFFGQQYTGDQNSVYEDVYADQFHRLIQEELFERQHPFIIDKDPGPPVWNAPVYSAYLEIHKEPTDPRTMHVKAEVLVADPHIDIPTNDKGYDYVGTISYWMIYTYDLKGDPQADGSIVVQDGVWTDRSEGDHPDSMTVVPDHGRRWSENKELDSAIVDEILKSH